jgi:hypothetical protein
VLELPVCTQVGDRGPVHIDVIVITEIHDFFSGELSVVVSNDRVRNPKIENDVLDEIHGMFGANFSQGLRLDPLSKFIDHNEQVGQTLSRLLEGSKEVQTPHGERPSNGDRLEFLGQAANLSSEVLASSTGSYYLCYITGRSRPVKTLSSMLLDET